MYVCMYAGLGVCMYVSPQPTINQINQAAYYFRQLMQGIAHCHDRKVYMTVFYTCFHAILTYLIFRIDNERDEVAFIRQGIQAFRASLYLCIALHDKIGSPSQAI